MTPKGAGSARKLLELLGVRNFASGSSLLKGRQTGLFRIHFPDLGVTQVMNVTFYSNGTHVRTGKRKRNRTREQSRFEIRNLRKNNPQYYLWELTKKRAAVRCGALPFTIKPSDITIPDRCPIRGTVLDKDSLHDVPTLVLIDPPKGFVPGNFKVVSYGVTINRQFDPAFYIWHKASLLEEVLSGDVPFLLEPEDIHIPEVCPFTLRNFTDPLLIRVNPKQSYHRANILVISRSAHAALLHVMHGTSRLVTQQARYRLQHKYTVLQQEGLV